jgi:hypothetical protein
MTIATGFDGTKPFSCAQGRYGELIIAQGNGLRPKRWTGVGTCTNAGIDAPATAPTINVNATKRYYVARVDVTKPGACYNAPPAVTFATPTTPPAGFRAAKATSYLSQSSVGEVLVTDGGKYYPDPPAVSLSATHGSGAVLAAALDGTPPSADGLHHWEIVDGPPFADETENDVLSRTSFCAWRPVELTISGTGGTVTDTFGVVGWDCGPPVPLPIYYTLNLTYTVTGAGTGTGCKIRVGFYGANYWTARTKPSCLVQWNLAWGVSGVSLLSAGSGYSANSVVRVEIRSSYTQAGTALTTNPAGARTLVIEGCTPGNARNTTTPRFKVASVSITNAGSGYNVAPEIKIKSTTGFGAYAESTVVDGKVTALSLESGGGGYRTVPTVTAVSGEAEAFAVARPHLRGKYQCYYRYVDTTPEASGGPIPSNLSPVREVDTGEGTQSLAWAWAPPANTDGRVLGVELWRSTGNQAITLYRVTTIPAVSVGNTPYVDDLTDEELRDANRTGYAAMPIVLPNGELNAMRFVPPPSNKSVAVRFQDRIWYGVDTSGTEPNSIYFSEVDEPESVPEINEFVLQQNARDADSITALVPFGSSLLIMQTRRCYSLSYAKKPLLDANVTPIAYRGCLNQRCWDMHGGVGYVMDRYGIYSITGSGEVQDLSAPIGDAFRSKINFSSSKWNFLVIDPVTGILRAFVAFYADGSEGTPTRVLCYSIESKTWWVERYPHRITAGVPLNVGGDYQCAYAAQGGVYLLDQGPYDLARGTIMQVTVTNRGAGYRTPPTVSAVNVVGAELQAVVDGQGRVGGIWILHGGRDAAAPLISISAPNDPTCTAPVQATATCIASNDDEDEPTFPVYRYKTGNQEYPTDATKGGDVDTPRSVSLTYRPQPSACEIAMKMYYNNSPHPRHNVAPRTRNAGFRATTPDAAARLDMGKLTAEYGYDNGVATSVLSGKTFGDMRAADRHVAVELFGASRAAQNVIVYQLDVFGTTEGG